MLTKRIIPCLDIKGGRVVKGVQFENIVDAGDPVENAKFYDAQGADELVLLDIMASADTRSILLDVVKGVAQAVFIPFTVGGGIRCVEDFRTLLNAGADKVAVNSAAIKRPELISEAAKKFGSQWDVYLNGGRVNTGLDAVQWAIEGYKHGAGEVLLTSMDGDGTKDGYDIALTAAISSAVPIPVIASGGAGTLAHFKEAIVQGKADAVLAASLFHYRVLTIQYLQSENIPVRIEPREVPK